jgi:hypothetical protein
MEAGWFALAASVVAAGGTVLSGYIALRVAQTRAIVNGQMDALRGAVQRLERQLGESQERARVAELP